MKTNLFLVAVFVFAILFAKAQQNYEIVKNPLPINLIDGEFIVSPIVPTTNQRLLKVKLWDNGDGNIKVEMRKNVLENFVCDGVVVFYKLVNDSFEPFLFKTYYPNSCSESSFIFELDESYLPCFGEPETIVMCVFPYGESCQNGNLCVGADGISPTIPYENFGGNPHILGKWLINCIEPSSNTIIIQNPNHNSVYVGGETQKIEWFDNISEDIVIDLLKGGSFVREIMSMESFGEFYWTIPENLNSGNDYQVKITSESNSFVCDLSENFEIINEPEFFINLNSLDNPVLDAGMTYTIRWVDNISENVKIKLYNSTGNIAMIAINTESDGEFVWEVPWEIGNGNDYRVKIESRTNGDVEGWSEYFSIKAYVPVNDDPCSAILVPSYSYENFNLCSNLGATHSNVNIPQCGDYNIQGQFGDIWYKFIVPLSGSIDIVFRLSDESAVDWAGEVYEGNCQNLVPIICDDDYPNDHLPEFNLTNRTPGEIIYLRIWQNYCEFLGSVEFSIVSKNLNISPEITLHSFTLEQDTVQKGESIYVETFLTNTGGFNLSGYIYLDIVDCNNTLIQRLDTKQGLNINENVSLTYNQPIYCEYGNYKIKLWYQDSDYEVLLYEESLRINRIFVDGIDISSDSIFLGEAINFHATVNSENSIFYNPLCYLVVVNKSNYDTTLVQMDLVMSTNYKSFDFFKEIIFDEIGSYEITYTSWLPFFAKNYSIPWFGFEGIASNIIVNPNSYYFNNLSQIPNSIIQDQTEVNFKIGLGSIFDITNNNFGVSIEFNDPNNNKRVISMNSSDNIVWELNKKMSSAGRYFYRFVVEYNNILFYYPANENTSFYLDVEPEILSEEINYYQKDIALNSFDCYKFTTPCYGFAGIEIFTRTLGGDPVNVFVRKDNPDVFYQDEKFDAYCNSKKISNEYVNEFQTVLLIDTINTYSYDNYFEMNQSYRKSETFYVMVYKPESGSFGSSYEIYLNFIDLAVPLIGENWEISQGYHGNISHNEITSEYAVDFNKTGSQDCGQAILASEDGIVRHIDDKPLDLGKGLRIAHGSGYYGYSTIYWHLYSIDVKEGQTIKKGQVIGWIGNTGNSSSCHLHFALQKGIDRFSIPPEPISGTNSVYPSNEDISLWDDSQNSGTKMLNGIVPVEKDLFILVDDTETTKFGDFNTVNGNGINQKYLWTDVDESNTTETKAIRWTPNIPENGNYNVFVNIGNRNSNANMIYTVFHSEGKKCISLRQSEFPEINKEFSSWQFLGEFHFLSGKNSEYGSVRVSNSQVSRSGKFFADGVVFCHKDYSPIEDVFSITSNANCEIPQQSNSIELNEEVFVTFEDGININTSIVSNDILSGVIMVYLISDDISKQSYVLHEEDFFLLAGDTLGINFSYSEEIPFGDYKLFLYYIEAGSNVPILVGNGYFENETNVSIGESNFENNQNKNVLRIFPNPVKENLFLVTESKNEFKIKIISMDGKLMYKNNLQNQKIVNISFLENGIYIIEIEYEERILRQHIVVMK